MGLLRKGMPKTEGEIIVWFLIFFDKAGGDVDDDTFIGRIGLDDRLMNLPSIDNDNIVRAELVGASLDTVGDIAAQQDQDFVKIVVVVAEISAGTVL